jgi:hypothetical protein
MGYRRKGNYARYHIDVSERLKAHLLRLACE